MIDDPPSFGALNATENEASPRLSVGAAGGSGGPVGVAGSDAALEEESPCAFAATTVQVYVLPLLSPVTMIGESLLWLAALLTLMTGYDYLRAGLAHMTRAPAPRHGNPQPLA